MSNFRLFLRQFQLQFRIKILFQFCFYSLAVFLIANYTNEKIIGITHINEPFSGRLKRRDMIKVAFGKLMVINITVDESDNPQLIFESLNSTGVDLTEGDKIRNYVLMGQKPYEQDQFYKSYWSKIEICTGNDSNDNNGVSLFIRDYLSMMRQYTPSMDRIYPEFKSYVAEKKMTMEELLKELYYYAKLYRLLISPQKEYDPKKDNDGIGETVNASIYRLNYLETTVSRPFFLQVLHLHKSGILTTVELQGIFLMVEDYLFRRNICEVPTNALNKIFLALDREIHRYDGTYDNYVEKMRFALTSKKESGRFPDDEEFRFALAEKQVYKMRGRYKNYLFERFENFGTAEVKDVIARIESGKYTIEHIMPQTLTADWKQELGENECEEIHSVWLHRLANLTLTAYNSSYSNNSFTEKRDAENGYRHSGIRMNQLIAQKERWTLAELEERSEYMVSRAMEIWQYPYTTYKPAEKQLNSVSLDDDAPLTGSQISRFSFRGTEQPVDSWSDMYTSVLKALHTEDSSVLTELAYTSDPNTELAAHVYSTPIENKTTFQIAPNIYVWTGTSTQHKLNTLRKFFSLFGADPADLVFYLRDQNEVISKTDSPERYETRRKYWSFALPYIQESFSHNGPFTNVGPSTSNWISGFFGAGGISINCIARFDCARIQFYLGITDFEGFPNYYLSDEDHHDELVEEDFEDEQFTEFLDEHRIDDFNGLELGGEYPDLFGAIAENPENPAVPLIRFAVAMVRCSTDEEEELIRMATGKYADELDIPVSDVEEEYTEDIEDEEDSEDCSVKRIIRIKTDASCNAGGTLSVIVLAHIGNEQEVEETAFYHFDGNNVDMFVESGCRDFDDEPEEDYIDYGDEDGLTDEDYGEVFTALAGIAAAVMKAIKE